jgi:regulatory protein
MRAFAYRLLGRREYSIWELGNRIRQKWPAADGVSLLLDDLTNEGLLSDERYAESFLRSRLQRFQGPLKIRAALRGKQVPDPVISLVMEAASEQWTELAADWLRRQTAGELDFEERAKYYRRLLNRGFTHDQAMDALDQAL